MTVAICKYSALIQNTLSAIYSPPLAWRQGHNFSILCDKFRAKAMYLLSHKAVRRSSVLQPHFKRWGQKFCRQYWHTALKSCMHPTISTLPECYNNIEHDLAPNYCASKKLLHCLYWIFCRWRRHMKVHVKHLVNICTVILWPRVYMINYRVRDTRALAGQQHGSF